MPEFAGTFDGVVDRLDYLEGLGVNCLSLMPITPVKHEFDWGYGPLGYFAPEDYLGGPGGLKRLVDAAHARRIAVVLDVVYGHAEQTFAYSLVYDDIRQSTELNLPNPMMQDPNRDGLARVRSRARAHPGLLPRRQPALARRVSRRRLPL